MCLFFGKPCGIFIFQQGVGAVFRNLFPEVENLLMEEKIHTHEDSRIFKGREQLGGREVC